jgi:hypothetical protein
VPNTKQETIDWIVANWYSGSREWYELEKEYRGLQVQRCKDCEYPGCNGWRYDYDHSDMLTYLTASGKFNEYITKRDKIWKKLFPKYNPTHIASQI